jgi:ATP-dependent HslUV protease subunit HslV
MMLFELLEGKLSEFSGNLLRASVELAKAWRSDKYLRRLDALMIAADSRSLLVLSGNGDVIEPEEDIAAIGSGGPFALAAARALAAHSKLSPVEIVETSLRIASEICVFTNGNLTVEVVEQYDREKDNE